MQLACTVSMCSWHVKRLNGLNAQFARAHRSKRFSRPLPQTRPLMILRVKRTSGLKAHFRMIQSTHSLNLFFFAIERRCGEVDRGVVESRIRTCEKCTGQLLRCCFAAVESLQTTDMPLLTRYVAGKRAEPASSTLRSFFWFVTLFFSLQKRLLFIFLFFSRY